MKKIKWFLDTDNNQINLKDYKGALSDFTDAITLNSEDSDAYWHRHFVKGSLGDYKGAVSDRNKSFELYKFPTSAVGSGAFKLDEFSETSLRVLKRLINIYPWLPSLLVMKANLSSNWTSCSFLTRAPYNGGMAFDGSLSLIHIWRCRRAI